MNVVRLGDFKFSADLPDCAGLDFSMPWKARDFSIVSIPPNCVTAAFTPEAATVLTKMTFHVEPFHAKSGEGEIERLSDAPWNEIALGDFALTLDDKLKRFDQISLGFFKGFAL
jgi:hypothetical protein